MIPYLQPSEWTEHKCGLFNLPEEVYRPAPGINQSTLKAILRSPAHAFSEMSTPKEPTPAMIMGSLAHLACLEPGKLHEGLSHHVKPDGLSFASKDGKAWREERVGGLPIITVEDALNLQGMEQAVASHEVAGRLISRGASEIAAFATHNATGLLMKGKIDKLFHDGQGKLWIADLKTTEDCRDFARSAANFKYDFQSAFYLDLVRACGLEVEGFVFLTVEKKPPFGIIVYQPDERFVSNGRRAYEIAMQTWLECETSGVWPSYPARIEQLELPAWAFKP